MAAILSFAIQIGAHSTATLGRSARDNSPEVLVQFESMCFRKGAKAPRESMNARCSFFSLRLCGKTQSNCMITLAGPTVVPTQRFRLALVTLRS